MTLMYVHDILATRKLRKFRTVSEKNIKDHEDVMVRIYNNWVRLDLVTKIIEINYGGKVRLETLLEFAIYLTKLLNIKLDRLAKRNRSALLCWFSENWDMINPYIHYIKRYKHSITKDQNKKIQYNNVTENQDPFDLNSLLNRH